MVSGKKDTTNVQKSEVFRFLSETKKYQNINQITANVKEFSQFLLSKVTDFENDLPQNFSTDFFIIKPPIKVIK